MEHSDQPMMSKNSTENPAINSAQAIGDSSQYVVVARRYRPQDFNDLVGQSQASTALKNAITQNRVGHAYLFTGARGVGKTSTARIFAKCLNCEKGPTTEPCNVCDICLNIATGEDIDVLEIDGASNRGIDEIRQLRSNANIRPSRSRHKVYIIDEVHMLTAPAFNALLKTLEEPPGHVKFIFCTTDPEKIPITVLSRCQRFDFVPVKLDAIKQRLAEIVASENLQADDDALALLARRAGGSMRDSQSLLEQVLSYCDGHITVQHVHELLGTADNEIVCEIAQRLIQSESAQALAGINDALGTGVDPTQLAEQLVAFFRDLMVIKVGGPEEILNATSSNEIDLLKRHQENVPIERIMASVQILDQSISRMRYSSHANVLIELAAVRICSLNSMNDLAALVDHVRSGNLPVEAARQPGGTELKKNKLNDSQVSTAIKTASNGKTAREPAQAATQNAVGSSKTNQNESPKRLITTENIESTWKKVLDKVADVSAEMARDFQSLKLETPRKVVVDIADKTKCDYCSQINRKQKFEQAIEAITGERYQVEFESTNPTNSKTEANKPLKSARQLQRELEKNPLVESAIKLLDGHVIDIKRPAPK